MSDQTSYDDVLQGIAEVQAALPQNFQYEATPVKISPAVNVKFPTPQSSLSRFHPTGSHIILDSVVTEQYSYACRKIQEAVSRQYVEVVSNLKSLEEFGGASDLSLQSHVAEDLSRLYDKWEAKLANSIIQRYGQPESLSKDDVQLEKVSPPVPSLL